MGLDAEVSVSLSLTPKNNPTQRRFFELELLRDRQSIMPAMWTVSHVIDTNSPLCGHTRESLEGSLAVITVVFKATDPVTYRKIHKVHVYNAYSIVFDGVFESVADMSEMPKRVTLDFHKFHHVRVDRKSPEA